MRADGALGQSKVFGEVLDLVFPGAQVGKDHQSRGVGQTVEQRGCGCVVILDPGVRVIPTKYHRHITMIAL